MKFSFSFGFRPARSPRPHPRDTRTIPHAKTTDHQRDTCGTPAGHQRDANGIPMGHQWHTSGTPVGDQWETSEITVGLQWDTSGTPVGHLWDTKRSTSGTPIGHQCDTSGPPGAAGAGGAQFPLSSLDIQDDPARNFACTTRSRHRRELETRFPSSCFYWSLRFFDFVS